MNGWDLFTWFNAVVLVGATSLIFLFFLRDAVGIFKQLGKREGVSEFDARVVSVHSGDHEDLHKDAFESVEVDFEGFPGDGHRGFTRVAWQGDKDPEGTVRRNERQWSGVSVEELAIIGQRMDLERVARGLHPGCEPVRGGIPDFSQLPRGTRLIFPSGAVLLVEETNPPCKDMGQQIAAAYATRAGKPADYRLFPRHSIGLRGVVGVVDVPGLIRAGDRYSWRFRSRPPGPPLTDPNGASSGPLRPHRHAMIEGGN